MRVATVDGLVTLFYDGSKKLFDPEWADEWLEERNHQWRISGKVYDLESWTLSNLGDLESWDLSDECKRYYSDSLGSR